MPESRLSPGWASPASLPASVTAAGRIPATAEGGEGPRGTASELWAFPWEGGPAGPPSPVRGVLQKPWHVCGSARWGASLGYSAWTTLRRSEAPGPQPSPWTLGAAQRWQTVARPAEPALPSPTRSGQRWRSPPPRTRAGRFLSEGLSLDLTQTQGRHRVGRGPQAGRETQGQPGPSLSRGFCPGRQRPEVAQEAESSCKLSPTRHPACTGRGGGALPLCRGRGACVCPSLPGLRRGRRRWVPAVSLLQSRIRRPTDRGLGAGVRSARRGLSPKASVAV